MRRQSLALIAASVAWLLPVGAQVRAEPITWTYLWTTTTPVVSSDDGSAGRVSLTTAGGMATGSQDSGPGILAAQLLASEVGTPTFTNQGYNLKLHLGDVASGTSGDLSFSGLLNGSLGGSGILTNSIPTGATQSLTLGGNQYSVTLGLFVPPLVGSPGRIGANVTVTALGGSPPPVANVPEPSALLLALGGAAGVGLKAWRRRRRSAAA